MKKFNTIGLLLCVVLTEIFGIYLLFHENAIFGAFGGVFIFSAYMTVVAYFRIGLLSPSELRNLQ
jgi:hypothetical protein